MQAGAYTPAGQIPMFAPLLALLLLVVPTDSTTTVEASQAARLFAAVQTYIAPFDAPNEDVQVRTEWADLNGDGAQDALVYLESESWCGSGGCTVLVFEAIPDSLEAAELGAFRPAAEISLMYGPVVVADTQTDGWKDLLVQDADGHMARLAFDGETYPMSPGDGVEMSTPAEGMVLFASSDQ